MQITLSSESFEYDGTGVRKNDNNNNNNNNNDNSALAVTLELVESSSSLSMDDNEEEEGEGEGGEGGDEGDGGDVARRRRRRRRFLYQLDPMEHLSSSIVRVQHTKSKRPAAIGKQRILTRRKSPNRDEAKRLESSEHREELKRQVEMLTEDLRRKGNTKRLFKLEQEKKEIGSCCKRKMRSRKRRTRRSEIES